MEMTWRCPCRILVAVTETEVEEESIRRQSGCMEPEEEGLTTVPSTYPWIVRGSPGLRSSQLHSVEELQAASESV